VLPGVHRHPAPCHSVGSPTVLVDAGANAECAPEWLVQFAEMGAAFFVERYGVGRPKGGAVVDRRGVLQGQQPREGDPRPPGRQRRRRGTGSEFVGNVEGRDLLTGDVDVIVADGFTGNVALKTLEGALGVFMQILGQVFNASPETKAAQ